MVDTRKTNFILWKSELKVFLSVQIKLIIFRLSLHRYYFVKIYNCTVIQILNKYISKSTVNTDKDNFESNEKVCIYIPKNKCKTSFINCTLKYRNVRQSYHLVLSSALYTYLIYSTYYIMIL